MATKKSQHKKEFEVTADEAVGLLKKMFNAVILRRVTVKDKKNKRLFRTPLIFVVILIFIPGINWIVIIAFLVALIFGYRFTFEKK